NWMSVPAALFAAARDGRIRITVGDGFDEASALSGRLRVQGAAPVVRILTPSRAESLRADATLNLFGEAFEGSGEAIVARGRLSWFDGRRRVARGRSATLSGLTAGRHRLRLQARSAEGKTADASVTVKALGVTPDL